VANCSSTYSLHFLITSTISLANHHARSGYLPHSLSRLPVRQTIIAPMALAHVVCWHARPHSQDRVSAHALFFLYIYFVRALPFSVCGVFVVRNSAIVSLCSSLPALDALASLYSAARDFTLYDGLGLFANTANHKLEKVLYDLILQTGPC